MCADDFQSFCFIVILTCTGIPGEPLPVTCEEDIFDYVGMDYKKPEERNL